MADEEMVSSISFPDGNKPAIHELYNDEREQAVPAEYRVSDIPLKGHTGLCAGRESELDRLRNYFDQMWEKERRGELAEDDCMAVLITNAPGAGKTTLKEEFEIRAAQAGIATIRMDSTEVASDADFVARLRSYAAGRGSRKAKRGSRVIRRLRELWYRVRDLFRDTPGAAIAGLAVETTVLPGAGTATAVTLQTLSAVRRNLHQRLRFRLWTTPSDALRLLSETHKGRFIIAIDECHTWRNPVTNRAIVSKNLKLLTDPTLRGGAEVHGGGVVLAGLGDAADDLDGLGLSRAEEIWLTELQPDAAAETIRYWIDRSEIDTKRRDQLAGPWTEVLTATFSHWAQHCAAAGKTARAILERTESAKPEGGYSPEEEETHLEWVKTMTAKQVGRLYRRRWKQSQTHGYPAAALWITALANRTGNRIPLDAVNHLLSALVVAIVGEGPNPEAHQRLLTALKRAGILRIVDEDPSLGGDEGWAEMPIPSLRRYITERSSPEAIKIANERAQAALKYAEETFGTKPKATS